MICKETLRPQTTFHLMTKPKKDLRNLLGILNHLYLIDIYLNYQYIFIFIIYISNFVLSRDYTFYKYQYKIDHI